MLTRNARLLVMFWLLLLPGTVHAQDTSDPGNSTQPQKTAQTNPQPVAIDPRFESPRATMQTFLDAVKIYIDNKTSSHIKETQAQTILSCFDWQDRARSIDRAIDLYNIFNKIGYIQLWNLPDATWAKSQKLSSFTFFPNNSNPAHTAINNAARQSTIILSRQEDTGQWKFSYSTVGGIPAFWRSIEHLPDRYGDGPVILTPYQWLRNKMPYSLKSQAILTLEYWQWIVIGILIFIGLTIDLIVRVFLAIAWKRILTKRGQTAEQPLIKRSVRPFGLVASSLIWFGGLRLISETRASEGSPDLTDATDLLLIAARFILMLSTVWAAYRVTDLIAKFFSVKAELTRTKLDDLLIPLLRKTLKVLVTILGVIYIADSLNIKILPLLTGLGIGGVAFAFAAKDTIENFFGSFAVIIDRPFEVGDWVVISDVEGTVEELGLRSTRIRTFYNSLVTVPNSTLVRAKVDNFGKRRYRRFKTTVGITYDTPPEKIEAFCEGIREIIKLHPYTRKDYFHVWLNSWGAASLDVLIYMFHECPDWATELRERHRFMLDVLRLASSMNIEFAFPTQTIHLQQAGDAKPEPYSPPRRGSEMRSRVKGRREARDLLNDRPWTLQDKPIPVSFGEDAHMDDLPMLDENDDQQTDSIQGMESSEPPREGA